MTHSPGPWTACKAAGGTCTCGLIWDATGEYVIATVVRSDDDHDKPPALFHANRRLIAAAPDLMKALKVHVYNCECAASSGCHAAQARALIATIEAP